MAFFFKIVFITGVVSRCVITVLIVENLSKICAIFIWIQDISSSFGFTIVKVLIGVNRESVSVVYIIIDSNFIQMIFVVVYKIKQFGEVLFKSIYKTLIIVLYIVISIISIKIEFSISIVHIYSTIKIGVVFFSYAYIYTTIKTYICVFMKNDIDNSTHAFRIVFC